MSERTRVQFFFINNDLNRNQKFNIELNQLVLFEFWKRWNNWSISETKISEYLKIKTYHGYPYYESSK